MDIEAGVTGVETIMEAVMTTTIAVVMVEATTKSRMRMGLTDRTARWPRPSSGKISSAP